VSISKFDSAVDGLDLRTRPKRRLALAHVIAALECIRDMEEGYLDRIHPNFHGGDAYAAAEECIGVLTDSIDSLMDAY
jgi:hypothetical protein